ncbi:MAG: ribonuclease T [Sphingomonadales bacterium]|nr:ribonuclease T [Sphingomonadales bacterium]
MRGVILGVALLSPLPAFAQAYQCRVPGNIELPQPIQPDGPSLRTEIGGYTLALSWSPEYCRGGRADDPGNMQCNGRNGRFGFVLHGLWPEAWGGGKPPQWCSLTPRPSADEMRRNMCITPVPWLLEHEWAKHGSCMSPNPSAYFKASAILWNSLHLPDADRLSRKPGLAAGDLRDAFVALNPAVPRGAVGILAGNGGWLREVHLCYGKDFMPRACDRRGYGPRDTTPLRIWRGL